MRTSITVALAESDRQLILLAIAELALSRPGFNAALERLAQQLQGASMFQDFKRINADRVRATHAAGGTSWAWETRRNSS